MSQTIKETIKEMDFTMGEKGCDWVEKCLNRIATAKGLKGIVGGKIHVRITMPPGWCDEHEQPMYKKHDTLGWLKCGACLEKEDEDEDVFRCRCGAEALKLPLDAEDNGDDDKYLCLKCGEGIDNICIECYKRPCDCDSEV